MKPNREKQIVEVRKIKPKLETLFKVYIYCFKEREKRGKCLEKSVICKADFVYIENGKQVVEDVKGVRTKEYIIKRKLMLKKYGIRIQEM